MVIHKRLRKIKWRLGGKDMAGRFCAVARDGPVQNATGLRCTAGYPVSGPGDRNTSWFINWFALATTGPSPLHQPCSSASGSPEHSLPFAGSSVPPGPTWPGDSTLPAPRGPAGTWLWCSAPVLGAPARRGQEQSHGTSCW